jgi:hypothetical protein
VKGIDEFFRHVRTSDALLVGALDDLVVDVGEVTHVLHVEPGVFEIAVNDVERDVAARVPDVAIIVNRHAAHVHADFAGVDRFEFFLLTGEGIVDLQHNHQSLTRLT